MKHGCRFWLVVCGLFLPVALSWAAEPYAVTFEPNVAVRMRDGVTLHADVYRPKADAKFPVLLQRTPYNKAGRFDFGLQAPRVAMS